MNESYSLTPPWLRRLKRVLIFTAFIIILFVTTMLIQLWYPLTAQSSIIHRHLKEAKTVTLYRQDQPLMSIPVKKHLYVPLSKMPKDLIKLTVSLKDRYYWIDRKDTYIRLILRGLFSSPQEDGFYDPDIPLIVAHNAIILDRKKVPRPLEEAVLAYKLADQYSKNEILEYYLNTLYFRQGIFGVASALSHYFGKDLSQLKPDEMACILGVSVDTFDSGQIIKEKHGSQFTITRQKRDHILDIMADEHIIPSDQAKFYKTRPLPKKLHRQ